MRFDLRRVKLSKRTLAAGACVAVAGTIVALMLANATTGSSMAVEPAAPTPVQSPAQPAPVKVPSTASGARSSGIGGATWTGGDAGQLGAEFRRAVANEFGGGSLGQAHRGMAALGFTCDGSGEKMSCEKSMQANNCTLTWSVRLRASGGTVSGAGGEGFSRDCT